MLDAFCLSWPCDPWLIAGLLLTAGMYLRGWRRLARRDPQRWPAGRACAFTAGLGALFLALGSPIEPFTSLLLQVHMVQHVLLMMVAPPLLWLGHPLFPMLRGLPPSLRTDWAAPFLRSPALRSIGATLTHPFVALPLFVAITWAWHWPPLYELALRSPFWHYLEHACFVVSALLFWYPVVLPEPSRPQWSQWLILPYLIAADVQNTVLSALLSFSIRVLYPHYEQVPRLGISALDDQAAAGVIMWIPGSIAYLVPLFAIAVTLLSGKERNLARRNSSPFPLVGEGWGAGATAVAVAALSPATATSSIPESAACDAPPHPALSHQGRECLDHANQRSDTALPILAGSPLTGAPHRPRPQRSPSPAWDLTRVPILGSFLRWRHVRLSLQLVLALLAVFVIWDGLRGPQTGAMNLAGVLPWIHWRGLLIFGLLVLGNVFCMACPFQLPRTLARHWRTTTRNWPNWLQSKWLAVGLVGVFLWAYEAFSLWDRPLWTAWIALGYFVAAFAVDSLFRDAAFCKYVCPIGQFNFVQSLLSPFEVRVREPAACVDCRTHDCLRGNPHTVGCEMGLFQPRKEGNLDCTFCLDCLHACPHDNIGILATAPGAGLWSDRLRAGIGRLSQRPDLAALVLLLVFGAFANAAGMVAPVVAWEGRLAARVGPMWLTVGLYSLLALIIAPALLVGAAALSAQWGGGLQATAREVACRYAYALVPMGGAMWLAHYSFHFLTSYASIVPTTQRFVRDLGGTFVGMPRWACACCLPVTDGLLKFELLALDVGLLASLYVAWRMACADTTRRSRALAAFLPWGALVVLLFVVGIWTIFQPMEMRGTLPSPAVAEVRQ